MLVVVNFVYELIKIHVYIYKCICTYVNKNDSKIFFENKFWGPVEIIGQLYCAFIPYVNK